jgi:hypothetical protein
MPRTSLAIFSTLLLAAPASAGWADGLFEELHRDFGTVPHGSMLSHPFRLTNRSHQTVKVHSLRVSCGCTVASMPTAVIPPGQSTVLTAQMDTRRFLGPKTVTIYVQFEQPVWEEVRLSVTANSRQDLAVTPETLAVGKMQRGESPVRAVTVSFLGDPSWQIAGAACESSYVTASVRELRRQGGEAVYEVAARMRPDVPVGRWFTDIWLTTNQPSAPRLRIPLTVEVDPSVSASPAAVELGETAPGQAVERRVLLRGVKPFRIVEVKGTDAELTVQKPDGADPRAVQVLTITYRPGAAGRLSRTLQIVTDLAEDNVVELPATAAARE